MHVLRKVWARAQCNIGAGRHVNAAFNHDQRLRPFLSAFCSGTPTDTSLHCYCCRHLWRYVKVGVLRRDIMTFQIDSSVFLICSTLLQHRQCVPTGTRCLVHVVTLGQCPNRWIHRLPATAATRYRDDLCGPVDAQYSVVGRECLPTEMGHTDEGRRFGNYLSALRS